MGKRLPLHTGTILLTLIALGVFQGTIGQSIAAQSQIPQFIGIPKYYDNRQCAVTVTLDDTSPLGNYSAQWQNTLSMLTSKHIYFTLGIITNPYSTNYRNWSFLQYWLNQGYAEAGSHSRNHVHVPYNQTDPYNGVPGVSYEWQINGSRQDIIGNLTLPSWQRSGSSQYVYAWIEPFVSQDATVLKWLGLTHYIVDRGGGIGNVTDYASWNSTYNVFANAKFIDGFSGTMPQEFDSTCRDGGIFHLIDHPSDNNWTAGTIADNDSSYLSNRTNVWYAPFGLLYLYHYVASQNITKIISLQDGTFQIQVNASQHQIYGLSYPVTYDFSLPSNFANTTAYYRYSQSQQWKHVPTEISTTFNGVTAARFDYANKRAYISLGFSSSSDSIYLMLANQSDQSSPSIPLILTGTLILIGAGAVTVVVIIRPRREPRARQ